MKKLLLFFVMAVFALLLPAQNVVSLVYQPLDLGLGVKYGRHFERSEMYVTASKGAYNLGEWFIKNHYKVTAGGGVRLENGFISAGVCYNRYGVCKGEFSPKLFNPITIEIGTSVVLNRAVVGTRVDLIKHELSIDIGICVN